MIPAKKTDGVIRRGDSYSLFFRAREKNPDGSPGSYIVMTGKTPTAELRATKEATTILATFHCSIGDQGTYPGSILIELYPSETELLTPGTAVADVQIVTPSTPEDQVDTYLEIDYTIEGDVTRGV